MISENLDYSMYGTWNGKPMLPSYNRDFHLSSFTS